MLTAPEAFAKVLRKKYPCIIHIENEINQKINEGKFSIRYNSSKMTHEDLFFTYDYFTLLGYNVEHDMSRDLLYISFDRHVFFNGKELK